MVAIAELQNLLARLFVCLELVGHSSESYPDQTSPFAYAKPLVWQSNSSSTILYTFQIIKDFSFAKFIIFATLLLKPLAQATNATNAGD